MKDDEIDDILKHAAGASPDIDPAVLERVTESLASSLHPVRPMAASWVLVSALVLVCGCVAIAGAVLLGPYGIGKMSALEITLILPVVGSLIWLAAVASVREMIPGSSHPFAQWVVPAGSSLALVAVFALAFDHYGTERFVPQGLKCLSAGLLFALPAALAGWLVLSRGFAVNQIAAGLAQGVLAGLAGIGMLELHCANFEGPHQMLWHVAVLPLCGAAGVLAVWLIRSRNPKR